MTEVEARAAFDAAKRAVEAADAAYTVAEADLAARGIGPYGPGTEHMLPLSRSKGSAQAAHEAAYQTWQDCLWRDARPASRSHLNPTALRRARLLWGGLLSPSPDDRHLHIPEVVAYLDAPDDGRAAYGAALTALGAARDADHPLAAQQRAALEQRYATDADSREHATYGWRGRMD